MSLHPLREAASIVAAAITVALGGCDGPVSDRPVATVDRAVNAIAAVPATSSAPAIALNAQPHHPAAEAPALPVGTKETVPQAASVNPELASWLAAVNPDSDPLVRRHALEVWAWSPTHSLDLVGAAMVDPDDSIRERAQQLAEESLLRSSQKHE